MAPKLQELTSNEHVTYLKKVFFQILFVLKETPSYKNGALWATFDQGVLPNWKWERPEQQLTKCNRQSSRWRGASGSRAFY